MKAEALRADFLVYSDFGLLTPDFYLKKSSSRTEASVFSSRYLTMIGV